MTTSTASAVNSPATLIADFTRSIPPIPAQFSTALRDALTDLAADEALHLQIRAAIPGGSEADRAAAARWLRPRFGQLISSSRIALTNGTQSAMLLLFNALVGRGGLLFAESLSWGVLRNVAGLAGVRLQGLAIDDEGIIPEAFEAACKAERPQALYCNPTDQNPTTAIMTDKRRRAIVDIARRYEVQIIEDDAIGRLHPDAPLPITAMAPEITWYVMGLTKCLAQGLRLAYVVGPTPAETERVITPASRLSWWAPSPLNAAVAGHWIESGTAEEICAAIRQESTAREKLASIYLAGSEMVSKPGAMHVWLPLGGDRDRHVFAQDLRNEGVLVRPAEMFAVDDAPPTNAVRLSLSSPLHRDDVERGLRTVARTLGLPACPKEPG